MSATTWNPIEKRGAAFGSTGSMAASFDQVPVIKREPDSKPVVAATQSAVGPTPTPTPSTDHLLLGLQIALAGAALVVLVLLWKKYGSGEQQ
ncbi:hypothetical protein QKT49_gp196 [Acanthamoeba castellanii medusavirus]|uniref:Uncharacterized protein n=1 Tax=Acanthamoeba castellanii medusavirus J1 TaxID=3114988 RepID=A0A3T1CXJ1_9VIRU|nr:hypothetical protein QKT49_gp196 [Acanthamoeba castellanii medusavirus]BBI30567.1 hypothetical protein [Acanthamoeba castellanii medusavirus J1]